MTLFLLVASSSSVVLVVRQEVTKFSRDKAFLSVHRHCKGKIPCSPAILRRITSVPRTCNCWNERDDRVSFLCLWAVGRTLHWVSMAR